jgi:hypothetical protein
VVCGKVNGVECKQRSENYNPNLLPKQTQKATGFRRKQKRRNPIAVKAALFLKKRRFFQLQLAFYDSHVLFHITDPNFSDTSKSHTFGRAHVAA